MLTYKRIPVRLSDPRFDKIVSQIVKSYPNSCVLWIDEVHNDTLLARYLQKKEVLAQTFPSVDELQVFHGTKVHCIDPICEEGFKAERNVTSAFGKGTYFAVDAMMSTSYMTAEKEISYMFLAEILVAKRCPYVQNAGRTLTLGECFVDAVPKSRIFVVPEDDSTYPRYVVAFHKNPPL